MPFPEVHVAVDEPGEAHQPGRGHAVDVRLGPGRLLAQRAQRLDHQLGALDVRDERHRVVDGHAPGAVPVRGDERGDAPAGGRTDKERESGIAGVGQN